MQAQPANPIFANVKEIKVANSVDQVNSMLKEGWVLLAIGNGQEQTGAHDYAPYFRYCLGK